MREVMPNCQIVFIERAVRCAEMITFLADADCHDAGRRLREPLDNNGWILWSDQRASQCTHSPKLFS